MVKSLVVLACALALCGCDSPTPPPNGVDGQAQAAQGHPFLAALGGSFLGSMLGNHFSRPSGGVSGGYSAVPPPTHTVINKTVVNKTIINHPPEVRTSPSVAPPKSTTVIPSVRPAASPQSYSRSYSSGSSSRPSVSYSRSFSRR